MAATMGVDSYYQGSRVFWRLSEATGLNIDQVNFVLSQSSCLVLAYIFRVHLHPSKVSTQVRHVYCLTFGLFILYFCFGHHILYVLLQAITCYTILRTLSPKTFQRYVMVFALSYLSLIHTVRQIYNYGSYTLDITGPFMVITQKVTSLAFCLHDGKRQDQSKLTDDQKKEAVKEMPSFLEYMSYCFHFQTLMCGPLIFYKDYLVFIAGEQYQRQSKVTVEKSNGIKSNDCSNSSKQANGCVAVIEPSPDWVAMKKVGESLIYALLLIFCLPSFPIRRVKGDEFVENTTLPYKVFYLMAATILVRTKYYHAWLLADGICNMSGLGFVGYDSKGEPKWDGTSNVDVLGFELANNLHQSLQHWNRRTGLWLRRVAYDRAPFQRTVLTYCLSAIWHGFYPGYYLTFLTGAVFTVTSRKCRRAFRPYFQTSRTRAFIYDVITFVITKVCMACCTFPFILLEFWPTIRIYRSMYFVIHLGTIGFFFIPDLVPLHASMKTTTTTPPVSVPVTVTDTVTSTFTANGIAISNGKNKVH